MGLDPIIELKKITLTLNKNTNKPKYYDLKYNWPIKIQLTSK